MSDKDVLDRFVQNDPLTVMTRCVVDCFVSAELNDVFSKSRSRQFEREQSFDAVALAVSDIAMGYVKNPRQAFAVHEKRLGVSLTAFYGKIKRTETSTSEATVRYSAEKGAQLQDQLGYTHWEVIKGYECFAIDGNHLQKTEKRLNETRGTRTAPLPGTVVAKYDMQRQIFSDCYMLEDAHAAESSVLDRVLKDLQSKQVLLADRHFCISKFLLNIASHSGYFVIRQHERLPLKELNQRKYIGRTETGEVYEQSIRIGNQEDGITIRRITIELDQPTSDGDSVIQIVSNLPSEVSACEIASAYRRRWEIEGAFYHLTTSLRCETKSLCYPKAALFLFAMAIMAYNARQVLFAALYAVHEEERVGEMSNYQIATDVTAKMAGFTTALPKSIWDELVPSTPAARAQFLRRVGKHVSMSHYKKTVRGPKTTARKTKKNHPHAHASVAKILKSRK